MKEKCAVQASETRRITKGAALRQTGGGRTRIYRMLLATLFVALFATSPWAEAQPARWNYLRDWFDLTTASGLAQAQQHALWVLDNESWFIASGFGNGVHYRTADMPRLHIKLVRDDLRKIQEAAQMRGLRPQHQTAQYRLANQAPYSVTMGPAALTFQGASVRMIEGTRYEQTINREIEIGDIVTKCNKFNTVSAFSGWATEVVADPTFNGSYLDSYKNQWLKGRLTRTAVETYREPKPDSCSRHVARYVYRYEYHGPDGRILAFFQRPQEVPGTSTWTADSCQTRQPIPAPEPDHFWSSEGNAALDTSNKCRPVIRWADGSTEEFHMAESQRDVSAFSPEVAKPFRPTCASTDLTNDLRAKDRNGNITTYRFTSTTETMIDPQGRETILTFEPTDDRGFRRLISVDLPSVGAAPRHRYTIQWRAPLQVSFASIWPDVTCRTREGAVQACGTSFVQLVDSVTIPDGRRYTFEYGPWGNLTRVTEPGGAIREFQYGDAANLAYARAASTESDTLIDSTDCGVMWSEETLRMHARGLVRERVLPDGVGGAVYETKTNIVVERLNPQLYPQCEYDIVGAATRGPDGCAQVWRENTLPDGSVVRNGTVSRAIPFPTDHEDDVFTLPPSVPVLIHGWSIGQERWSGPTLLSAQYSGDKQTGELYYDFDLVKAVTLPGAIPANVRPSKAISFKDGLYTTSNFVYGNAVDIDPNPTAQELRDTESAVSTCLFGGLVVARGCTPPGGRPLVRTDNAYVNYHGPAIDGPNLLGLAAANRIYGPNSTGTAFSTTALAETSIAFDQFAVVPSGRPSSSLDPNLGRAAGTPRGNATRTTQRVSAGKFISSEIRYFDTGDVQSSTDAMRRTMTSLQDFSLCSSSTPRWTTTTTNALGHVASITVDCSSGLTLKTTDANGESSFSQYDHLGRFVETAGPGDQLTALPQSGAQAFTRAPDAPTGAGTKPGDARAAGWREYLDFGILGRQRTVIHDRDGSPDGYYVKSFMDGLGRTVQTRSEADPARSGFAEVVSTTVYDGLGRAVKSLVPCFAASSSSITPHCGSVATEIVYDALSRPTKVTSPGAVTVTSAFTHQDGRWLTINVDGRGLTTKRFSNLLGQVEQIDRQSALCGGFCTERATFDAAGRTLTQGDAEGNTIRYTYDDLGRPLSMSDPNLGNLTYAYDDNGNLTRQVDAKGQTITFNYDALNRLTLKDLPPAGPSIEDVTNFYDGQGPKPPDPGSAAAIASIAPNVRDAGTGAFTLTVDGSNFVAGSVVTFNGQSRATTFVSSQQLRAAILAGDVNTAGSFPVMVVSPAPGGASNAATFVVNARPVVSVTRPAASAIFDAPASIIVEAAATDGDGIRQVEFFQGAATLGVDQTAPYSVSWSSVPEGTYRLTAVATDTRGSTTTSAPVDVTVRPGSPVNASQFVSQSVPAVMVAGRTYNVSVTVQNSGTTTWTAADKYNLGSEGPRDNQTWGLHRAPLPGSVPPGAQVTIPFTVTAPATPGEYGFQWGMVQDMVGGGWFGATPRVTVRAESPVNASQFVSQSVPAVMVAGRTYNVSVTVQNSGTTTWTAADKYNLGSEGPRDNQTWGLHRAPLPGSVPPGAQVTIPFTVTAPATPGEYGFQWGMVRDMVGGGWFGATPRVTVRTEAPVNAALFVSQSVPAVMAAGRTYAVSVTMQNSGTTTWTAADKYNLGSEGPRDNQTWGLHRAPLPGSVPPGAQVTIQFTVTAPATPGEYGFQWGMVRDMVGGGWFGATPRVTVRTEAAVNASRFVSQIVPAAMIAGRTYTVSVKMQNSGTTTWTAAGLYNLGSHGPQDNTTWGLHRTPLPASVPPGAETTFQFTVTAPATPANYVFQWRTVQDTVQWFGELTPAVTIPVLSAAKTGLIASWNFDEGMGTTTADATGNGSTGTAGKLDWTKGRMNSGLRFVSTTNNPVRISPSPRVSALSNDFTVSFWAQPESAHQIDVASGSGASGVTGQKYVIGPRYESFGDAGIGISLGNNGVSVYEHSASHMPAVLVYSAPISGWTHIAVVYENKRPTLYVNGTSVLIGGTSSRSNVYAVPADIGGMAYGYYDGLLDEVRIHDSALSPATIAAMAQETVADLKIDGETGTVVADASADAAQPMALLSGTVSADGRTTWIDPTSSSTGDLRTFSARLRKASSVFPLTNQHRRLEPL
ncbi:MAG TPA: LamG-like jellyroll fold domain-containing protein [Thermoanaerobaculia bacterium]|nr:LamG-like jellyroll fold domain-containing protein [Thermoanaerobaculia bacterium]